jgi:CubicO group peptidase (beta-lactamase class C family)
MNAAPAPDFAGLHAAMQRWVDGGFLAGVSIALWRDGAPVHLHCTGQADRERGEALREDHLFRLFSSTKLFTSIAALLLMEDRRLDLDDAVERFLPGLAARRVLRTGASSIDDTEPARGPITIAQLMSHSAGLAYGLLDPGSLLHEAYTKQRILARDTTLEQMVQALALLPHNRLSAGCWQQFPDRGVLRGRAHGLAGGLVLEPGAQDDARSAGEIYWGGMAGTQWWIAPRLGLAGALMTQRFRGYGDPFVADLKREAYRALLGPAPGA